MVVIQITLIRSGSTAQVFQIYQQLLQQHEYLEKFVVLNIQSSLPRVCCWYVFPYPV